MFILHCLAVSFMSGRKPEILSFFLIQIGHSASVLSISMSGLRTLHVDEKQKNANINSLPLTLRFFLLDYMFFVRRYAGVIEACSAYQ